MTLFLLSDVLAKRGISHRQSNVDGDFVKVYWIIDGASLPVALVNLRKGTFLKLRDYFRMPASCKAVLATAEEDYRKRFRKLYKKS